MTPYTPVTHVIFDMDGLLLDTERLYSVATQELASRYDKQYTWDIKVRCMGMTGHVAASFIVEALGLPLTTEEYMEAMEDLYKEQFPRAALLPDSVGQYLEIHQAVLAEYGLTCTWADLMEEMGHTAMETAQNFCTKKAVSDTPESYREKVAALQHKLFPSVELVKGAERLVRHLHRHGVPIAIASGSSQSSYDLKTTDHRELMSLFSHTVLTSSDPEVQVGKPAPDVFLVCADRFAEKPEPGKCLVLEDAPNGVQAAVAAGMQVVMVPDSRTDSALTRQATLVLPSLDHFKPELFGLPPYDDQ